MAATTQVVARDARKKPRSHVRCSFPQGLPAVPQATRTFSSPLTRTGARRRSAPMAQQPQQPQQPLQPPPRRQPRRLDHIQDRLDSVSRRLARLPGLRELTASRLPSQATSNTSASPEDRPVRRGRRFNASIPPVLDRSSDGSQSSMSFGSPRDECNARASTTVGRPCPDMTVQHQ